MRFSFLDSMNINQLYTIFSKHPEVSTDSRKISQGSIFFALRGENFDGNLFASKALEQGASYAVVDNPEIIKGDKYILTENTLSVLQKLANYHRIKLRLPIVAITGTNGKTTTKELIAKILSQKYKVGVTQGNLNNHIGVPLTLLSMNKDSQIGVVEMGANHPGEINVLCEIAQPDYGLITNIGKAHLEGFGSFEGVIDAKSEMYRYIEKSGGKIFVHTDNPLLIKQTGPNSNIISYGSDKNCFLRAERIQAGLYVQAKVWADRQEIILNSHLTGSYNHENIIAAACVGKYFGIDPALIRVAIGNYYPQNYRSQLIEKNSNQIIMDAYNANPTSMRAAIENFLSLPASSRILIIGDMLELGSYSTREHQQIVDFISDKDFSRIIIVGNNFRKTDKPDNFISVSDVNELRSYLDENPIRESLVLIKGSRGIQLEKALESI